MRFFMGVGGLSSLSSSIMMATGVAGLSTIPLQFKVSLSFTENKNKKSNSTSEESLPMAVASGLISRFSEGFRLQDESEIDNVL
jgi:hypothetical protein